MGRITRVFQKGRMNKDIDERLLPAGEYREALNIQVATTEDDAAGIIQNILGNSEIPMPRGSYDCIGSAKHEASDYSYWFLSGKTIEQRGVSMNTIAGYPSNAGKKILVMTWDYIVRSRRENQNGVLVNATEIVLASPKEILVHPATQTYNVYDADYTTANAHNYSTKITLGLGANGDFTQRIRTYNDVTSILAVGDRVNHVVNGKLIDGAITDILGTNNNVLVMDFKNPPTYTEMYGNVILGTLTPPTTSVFDIIPGMDFIKFTSDLLGFSSEKLITGINIVDDMLLWVTPEDEPKRISISRSVQGSTGLSMTTQVSDQIGRTRMINSARGFNDDSTAPFLSKKMITVIKTPPTVPLSFEVLSEDLANSTATAPIYGGGSIVFPTQVSGANIENGDEMWITMSYQGNIPLQIIEGDIIRFNDDPTQPPPDFYGIRGQVLEIHNENHGYPNASGNNQHAVRLQILGVTEAAQVSAVTATSWACAKEISFNPIFADELPRFSYRYKYETGELSSFAPFSAVCFEPSSFSYHPNEGYNLGMKNKIKKIDLFDFISGETPDDVVGVDLLLKFDDSPVVYLMDTLRPTDSVVSGANAWFSQRSAGGLTSGVYEITNTVTYAALPSNQLLRNKDTVPVKAKAQAVIGNRVVYGNYVQGHDLVNEDGSPFNAVYSTTLVDRYEGEAPKQAKSIKSLREYDLGIVWGDSYGRETPVQTAANSGITIGKNLANRLNAFKIEITDHPYWSEYYKVYIKVKEGEYYNFPVGRVYDASDGSIWLAIPSSERNKVEENKYITLKKPEGSDELVEQEAKYKITSIVNEAPDYIKTKTLLIAETRVSGITIPDSCTFYGGEDDGNGVCVDNASLGLIGMKIPRPGAKMFTIHKNLWAGAYTTGILPQLGLSPLDELLEEHTQPGVPATLFFQAVREVAGLIRTTKKYRVISTVLEGDHYQVNLESRIHPDDSFLADPNDTNLISDLVTLQFLKTETKNKPEFDGRFFLKISADDTTLSKLVPTSETASLSDQWSPNANLRLYGIGADDWNNTAGPYSVNNNGATFDNTDYNSIKEGIGWFIDTAPFAAVANTDEEDSLSGGAIIGINDAANITQNSCDITSSTMWTYKGYYFDGTLEHFVTHATGTGESSKIFGMRGAFTETNANYIDISHFLGSGDTSGKVVDFKENDADHEQIIVGSYFSVDGGINIYRIKSKIKFRLYNGWGKYTVPYDTTLAGTWNRTVAVNYPHDKNYMEARIRNKNNRRVTYRLEYELIEGTVTDLATNADIAAASPTTFANLEFLSFYESTDEGNPISRNPAIMETIPDEVAGNIYYEATPALPAKPITSFNADVYFPVNSVILIPLLETGLNGMYVPNYPTTIAPPGPAIAENAWIAAGARNGSLKVLKIESDTIWFNASISSVGTYNIVDELLGLDRIQITTPAGFTYYVKITHNAGSSNSNTTNKFKYILLPGVKLDWSNCWSFTNGVESNRIGDNFNQPSLTPGVIASTTLDEPTMATVKPYGLIYSGLYNSDAQVNNLNQFIQAEKITKDLNPVYGSIQKLHDGNSNLIAFCEDKVLKILANKDALYNADGNSQLTSTNNVLGTAIPYAGEYGISKNPESFAESSYRSYFTDRQRGVVLRLSKDGLTPISKFGMRSWFRDHLKQSTSLIGTFDSYKEEYNITIADIQKTVTFREDVRGWTSFKSFVPQTGVSVGGNYYTFKNNKCWLHHDKNVDHNTFYGGYKDSELTLVFNNTADTVKSFANLKYSGTQAKISRVLDGAGVLIADDEYYNLVEYKGWHTKSIHTDLERGGSREFKPKEGMWFSSLHGESKNINNLFQNLNLKTEDFSSQGLGIAQDATLETSVAGCTDADAFNWDVGANIDDGSCIPVILGCAQPGAQNSYAGGANTDDGSCLFYGCMDEDAFNYDATAAVACNSCCVAIVYGCIYATALNFDITANTNETSATDSTDPCIDRVFGCIDSINTNVVFNDSSANTPDFSCMYEGCTDINADNNYVVVGTASASDSAGFCISTDISDYPNNVGGTWISWSDMILSNTYINALAAINNNPFNAPITAIPPCPNQDDGSCTYTGCGDAAACNFDPLANFGALDGCVYCSVPMAINYDGHVDGLSGINVDMTCNISPIIFMDASDPSYDPNNSVIIAMHELIPGQQCQFCEQVMAEPVITNLTHNSFDITWLYPNDNFGVPLSMSAVESFDIAVHTSEPAINGTGFNFQTNYIDPSSSNYGNQPAVTGDGTVASPFTLAIDATNYFMFGQVGANSTYYVKLIANCDTNGAVNSNNTSYNVSLAWNWAGQGTNNYSTTWSYDGTTTHITDVQIDTPAAPPPPVYGCWGGSYTNPFNLAIEDGSAAFNYDPTATVDDGTCYPFIYGCTDPAADNYIQPNPNNPFSNFIDVNTDDGSCTYPTIYGCNQGNACNYANNSSSNFVHDTNTCVTCADQASMDYNGDNADLYGTSTYGGGGDFGSYGNSCDNTCSLYCDNPPIIYDNGIFGPNESSITLGQVGDVGVSYDAAFDAWNTFVTVKIPYIDLSVNGQATMPQLANGGFIKKFELTKTDSNGVTGSYSMNWSSFAIVGDYHEATININALFATSPLPELGVLNGEEYTFSLNTTCAHYTANVPSGYSSLADGIYSGSNPHTFAPPITYNI